MSSAAGATKYWMDPGGSIPRKNPKILKRRKTIVEHPFGTMKHWWDQGFFLMKGLEKVGGEFSLTTLAYNMKRVVNILGVPAMVEGLR